MYVGSIKIGVGPRMLCWQVLTHLFEYLQSIAHFRYLDRCRQPSNHSVARSTTFRASRGHHSIAQNFVDYF